MPIWDYECPICSKEQEDLLRNYDDVVLCECGEEMVKLPCTPAWMFKQHHGTDKGRLIQTSNHKRFKSKDGDDSPINT